jgi:hypothetical protein
MRRLVFVLGLVAIGAAVLVNVPPTAAIAKTIYVSPAGNDAWSGQSERSDAAAGEGPVATLTRARDLVREWKRSGPLAEPVHVVLADGVYETTEPFVLAPEDSGTRDCPISYEAAPGARPIISGGRALRGFARDQDGLWKANIPEVTAGRWYFEQLYVDGRRAVRARTPNRFYDYMGQTSETPVEGKPGVFTRMSVVPPSVLEPLKSLSDAALRDVTLVAYHKWCITRRLLTRIDTAAGALVTVGEQVRDYSDWPVNTRFHLENFKAALDQPGEWFLARDGSLYYKPLPDQDMTKAQVVAPVARKLLVLAGEPEKGRFVEHVTFRGLTFEHNSYPLPPAGYVPWQAACVTEAALMADGARNVEITDCEIGHTGDYAVWFRRGCRDCLLRHCYLHDLGAGGARIGEGQDRANHAEQTSRVTLDNNIIHGGGRTYDDAVGIWIGQSADNVISHNDIGDFFYSGISVGWRWGYAPSLAKRNRLSFNRVHHIGQGVLSDMGGIYTLGPSEGTAIRNNVFHDVHSYSYGGWGMYTDEGSTGITMENNLVYNTKTGSFHQHYGRENVVRNNILASSQEHQLQATRIENYLSFTFERNIVYWRTGPLLAGPWGQINIVMDNNCYSGAAGQPVTFAGMDLKAWQVKGHDQHSIIADPKFADPDRHDYHLAPDSPALGLGFKPFDYTQAGVYGDPSWRKKAADAPMASLELPPPPPSGAPAP